MVYNPDRDPDALVTRLAKAVEWLAVTWADQVLWHDGMQMPSDYFEHTYSGVDPDRFFQLPFFGFDPAKFDSAKAVEYDEFTITYAGSFYDGWIEPFAFLEGLGQYVDSAGAADLRVQFYVREWPTKYREAATAAGVSELIDIHGFVPHDEIVPVLLGSDALVHVGGNDERNRLNIPSKIADYIGAGRPMIAIVDPSFRVAELIEQYSLGVVCDPADPGEVATAIQRIREGDFEYGRGDGLDGAVVRRFTRTYKLDLLADVLDAVSRGHAYDPARDASRAVPDA
jgi:glycosyltransferase involved in cell wall biosynthesis